MTKMRTQINTTEIRNAYKEVEIKSAVIIGIDYGFETNIDRTYCGTIVKFREIYTDGRKWDIEGIIIQFLNDNNMNETLVNKIRVFKEKVDVKREQRERVKEGEKIFQTWGEALPHIMELVWSIENA